MLKMFITAGKYLLKSAAVVGVFTKVAPIAAEYAIGAEIVVAGTASATAVYFGVAVVVGAVAIWAINKLFELLSAYIDSEETKAEEKAVEAVAEQAEEAKAEEAKAEEAKVEEAKAEEAKAEEAKAEAVVVEKVEVEEVAVSKNNGKKHSK